MDNRKLSRLLMPRTSFYIWVILVLLVIITILEWQIGVVGYIFFFVLLFYNFRVNYKRQRDIIKYIENLTFNIDSASKDTLLNFPMPLVVAELDGTIIWYNQKFKNMFKGQELLKNTVSTLVNEIRANGFKNKNIEYKIFKEVVINGTNYRVLGNFVKHQGRRKSSEYILLLYFIDITDFVELRTKYYEEKPVCGIVAIDNYDELMQSLENYTQAQLLAEIDKVIVQNFTFTNGILKKYERDKYLLVFKYKYVKELEERKFDILDVIKEINAGNKIPVTLSIGFGINNGDYKDNMAAARAALDLALGRGGDQVVIKEGDNFRFYGGRTRELEKRTRVRARVIAYALRELIDQSSQVIIMGHENPDVDVMGAALGVFRIAKSRNKDAYIVLSQSNPSIDTIMERIRKSGAYEGVFIGKDEAQTRINKKTLLVIVDTYRAKYTEYPELLKYTNQIVVIDHHRRGADFIKETTLTYQEIYASSTSEMVVEIIQYVDSNIKLSPVEREALYAGIVVDTKGFTFKTGVRTFEAASFLKKQGVDPLSVKQLFQNDLSTFMNISITVGNAEMVWDGIAISVCPSNIKNAQLIAARAADEILNLSGIKGAFVLCEINNGVAVSARSFGDINVQMILEKLGGGGHQTVAGAQLQNISVEEAKEKLKYAIIEYIKEIEKGNEK
ncbi:MAG TPA: phosphoesterase [Clostridiaceae bacterium]|nr:phosphoesterase [Clostridiaceae bacterium]